MLIESDENTNSTIAKSTNEQEIDIAVNNEKIKQNERKVKGKNVLALLSLLLIKKKFRLVFVTHILEGRKGSREEEEEEESKVQISSIANDLFKISTHTHTMYCYLT